jgi:hypothetical protein
MTGRPLSTSPRHPSVPVTEVLTNDEPSRNQGLSKGDRHEPVLYLRKRNLLIKFNGLYWYWSSKKRSWIPDKNHAKEHWNIRDLKYTSEQEVKQFIRNTPFT